MYVSFEHVVVGRCVISVTESRYTGKENNQDFYVFKKHKQPQGLAEAWSPCTNYPAYTLLRDKRKPQDYLGGPSRFH